MRYFNFETLGTIDLFLRLAAAGFLPLAIGLERYMRKKPIDFRPFVIISLASCGILIATNEFGANLPSDDIMIDPTRIMQGVITGIGFLGAGAMFRDGDYIKGAGTAASIWSAGIIGLLCGLGQLGLAAIITVVILAFMTASAPFTNQWDTKTDD